MSSTSFDFSIVNHGSIVILNAISEAAKTWADEHLPEDRQTWGANGTVIEPRYVGPIVDGIINDGLTVA